MSISRVIDSDARYANDTVSRIRLLEKSSISYTKQARWIGLEPLVLWKHVSFIGLINKKFIIYFGLITKLIITNKKPNK